MRDISETTEKWRQMISVSLHFFVIILWIGIEIMGYTESTSSLKLTDLLPSEINGWKSAGSGKLYNAETLYKYIDGSAEVYRSFNVQNVLARRYIKDNAPEILADIFDMGSSKDAFGVYHHDIREGPKAGIGQDSEYFGSSLFFWKNRFFVSIISTDETGEANQTIYDLGKVIAERIRDDGLEPDLLKLLSNYKDAIKDVHYFHNHYCLNKYYFISEENLLNLDSQTEGILAHIKDEIVTSDLPEASHFVVLLIRYNSSDKAQEALKKFLANYLLDTDKEGTAQTENSKWASATVIGNIFIGVFDAPSKDKIKSVLDNIKKLCIKTDNL
jgi:hypothetical protein